MHAAAVVVVRIRGEDATQMALVEDHNVVKTFSAVEALSSTFTPLDDYSPPVAPDNSR
jgi:hypothetical protein